MIPEESCDTEDWSNGFWKFSFAIKIIVILQYFMQIWWALDTLKK